MVKLFDDPEKDKKWKDRIWLGIFIIGAFLVWVMITPAGPATEGHLKYSKMSYGELKDASSWYSYDQLARNPSKYIGKPVKISGEIIQVQQSGNSYVLRVATKMKTYGTGYLGDDIWVNYATSGSRPLEGDVVMVLGVSDGMKTYDTVLGASRSVPSITAYYF